MVKYNIISTGSDGNATILEDFVLIDCGVPYKALEPYVTKLKLVLLTHIHSDHFQKRTIKRACRRTGQRCALGVAAGWHRRFWPQGCRNVRLMCWNPGPCTDTACAM